MRIINFASETRLIAEAKEQEATARAVPGIENALGSPDSLATPPPVPRYTSLSQHEGHFQDYVVADHLTVLDRDFLVLHPRALDVEAIN